MEAAEVVAVTKAAVVDDVVKAAAVVEEAVEAAEALEVVEAALLLLCSSVSLLTSILTGQLKCWNAVEAVMEAAAAVVFVAEQHSAFLTKMRPLELLEAAAPLC